MITSLLSSVCEVPAGLLLERTPLGNNRAFCEENDRVLQFIVTGDLCNLEFPNISIGNTRSVRFQLSRASDGLIFDTLQACFDNTNNVAPEGYVYTPSNEELEYE